MTIQKIKSELAHLGNPKKAAALARYFKTGPGMYAEGDTFLGITVPEQRKVAKKYRSVSLPNVQQLLHSPIHEYRLTALVILTEQYRVADVAAQKRIVQFYLKHITWINNWDLVDTSAPYILGDYFLDKDKQPLYTLCRSTSLWERRIAIVTTHGFIKRHQFTDTLRMAELLLNDPHDLLHKATGWMLREVGERDTATLVRFLDQHHQHMPRTMVRYAIEKFTEKTRARYLKRPSQKK